METYLIQITFTDGVAKHLTETARDAAYDTFETACYLATNSNGIAMVELYSYKDENPLEWEFWESEKF